MRNHNLSRNRWLIPLLLAAVTLGASRAGAQAPGPVLPDIMDRDTVKSINMGLEYLAKTQRPDGSWLNSGGYGSYPQVMTSLSGLAFLASGSTPEAGRYSRNVRKAMIYILHIAEANNDGLIAGAMENQSMFGHGFAMLFLAQCYGMDVSTEYGTRIKNVLDKAVLLTARSQSDLGASLGHAGGWIYTPSGGSDEGSVTVTQLQALRACRNVGIKVPKSTIDRAVAYLKHCQMADGGICYSAQSRSDSRPPISAAGIACFYSAGVYDQAAGGSGDEAKMVQRLIDFCKRSVKIGQDNGHYYYTHLYYAQAMYQRGGNDDKAKREWHEYYKDIGKWMLKAQSPDGSWSGDGVGTTYGTAIACIVLQLPYGYLPIYQR